MENVNPQLVRRLAKEVRSLISEPLEGIVVHAPGSCSDESSLASDKLNELEATVTGPVDTPYADGQFRVRLLIETDFPLSPPKGFFVTPIFHPNISSKGEICVNTLKKDWNPQLGLKHVLMTIKCLLIVPNPESALNEEAGKLLLDDYEQYCTRARIYTEIHAKRSSLNATEGSKAAGESRGAELNRHREKRLKERKRNLKRL